MAQSFFWTSNQLCGKCRRRSSWIALSALVATTIYYVFLISKSNEIPTLTNNKRLDDIQLSFQKVATGILTQGEIDEHAKPTISSFSRISLLPNNLTFNNKSHSFQDKIAEINRQAEIVGGSKPTRQSTSRIPALPINISFEVEPLSFQDIAANFPQAGIGGHFKPLNNVTSRVAVIIPFRNRSLHLRYFLQYMIPILLKQMLDFRIYIINQVGNGTFNRAKLLNVGFFEALKDYHFDCFIFHDVDLILENERCLYSCPSLPTHLSVAVDKFNYKFEARFGGATMLTKEHFESLNGYSNLYWGWGCEDEDMFARVTSKYKVNQMSNQVCRYKMIRHDRESANKLNVYNRKLMKETKKNMMKDGLNSLEFKIISRDFEDTYTNITVDIFAPEVNSPEPTTQG